MSMKRLIPILLSVVLLAAACGDDASPTDVGAPGDGGSTTSTTTTAAIDLETPEGSLADARARWAANGLTDYRLTTAELCFCPQTEWTHTVVDGVVTDHQPVGDEAFYDPGPRSMETLFDEIDAAIADGYHTLDLDFDPETGAVVRYWVDVDEMIADEEHGVEVTSLTPYDPDAELLNIDAAALVDDYGCGYVFAKGNADQSLRLLIEWRLGFQPDAEPATSPIEFPARDWSARVQTGTDLFSNWCDDVIEPDEPDPLVTQEWSIVAGTLTFTSTAPVSTDNGGAEVTATLTDAVAESVFGERLELGDVDLRNGCWGCRAG